MRNGERERAREILLFLFFFSPSVFFVSGRREVFLFADQESTKGSFFSCRCPIEILKTKNRGKGSCSRGEGEKVKEEKKSKGPRTKRSSPSRPSRNHFLFSFSALRRNRFLLFSLTRCLSFLRRAFFPFLCVRTPARSLFTRAHARRARKESAQAQAQQGLRQIVVVVEKLIALLTFNPALFSVLARPLSVLSTSLSLSMKST